MYGVVDLMVGMQYEVESRRFKNTMDENIHYGWEERTVQSTIGFESQAYESNMPFEPYDAGDAPF